MSEFWDVYDKSGKKKNRVIRRGDDMNRGDYHIVSEAWIRVDKNIYLIQKRSLRKRVFGGMWYCSVGGSVLAGEEARDGIIRESKEELGLDISRAKIRLKRIITEEFKIFYIYLIDLKVRLEDLVLQSEEVSDVKFASVEEIFELIDEGQMIELDYYKSFFDSASKIPMEYAQEEA